MNGRRWILSALICALLGMVGGCCVERRRAEPPPPISLEEQVGRLTAWSRAMPLIKAKTGLAGVRIDYRDEQGHNQSQPFEGTLVIRQHQMSPGEPADVGGGAAGDVLLLGESNTFPVLEAGRNDSDWWFVLWPRKVAWTGDARRPVNLASLGQAQSGDVSVLRADLVLELLGLTPLPPSIIPREPGKPFLLMRVNDFDGTNDLFIEQAGPDGRPNLVREIRVDRFTDQVSEVRFYDPAGLLVVRSVLEDYKPVAFDQGVARPGRVVAFPRKVTVSYPAQHTMIALQFAEVTVKAELPDRAFRSPDFEELRGKGFAVRRAE